MKRSKVQPKRGTATEFERLRRRVKTLEAEVDWLKNLLAITQRQVEDAQAIARSRSARYEFT